MSSSTGFDVGTPRLPFGERSAKALYKVLLDVDEVLNREELKTLQLCRQIPAHTVEDRKGTEEFKSLLVQSEAELRRGCSLETRWQCRTRKVCICRTEM